jgi:hypothetical protein
MSPLAKLLTIAFLAAFAGVSFPAEQSKKTDSRPTGMFQVNVTDDTLSLNADDAPLAQIFREIARQSGITIDSNIGPEEKITTRLERVPLEDGIKQLAKNVSVFYAQDPKSHTRRIARVVVLSESKTPATQTKTTAQPEKAKEPRAKSAKDEKSNQAEPFKFQFDPKKSGETKNEETKNEEKQP